MSRQIDLTKPLSDEDRQYLVDRARHHDLALNEEYLAEQEAAKEPIDDGNTGDINPYDKDDGTDLLAGTHPGETAVTEAQRQQVLAQQSEEDPNKVVEGDGSPLQPTQQAGDGESEHDDNYDDAEAWSYRDLQKEIGDRNEGRDEDSRMSASGSREDLVERLRADDAEG